LSHTRPTTCYDNKSGIDNNDGKRREIKVTRDIPIIIATIKITMKVIMLVTIY